MSSNFPLHVAAKVLPLLGAVCLLIVRALAVHQSDQQSKGYFTPWAKENILDGCHHVYLDMGTNM